MSTGSVFQMLGAAAAKLREPKCVLLLILKRMTQTFQQEFYINSCRRIRS